MKILKSLVLLFFLTVSQNLFSQCWKEIAAGSGHTLAIKTDGTLWGWGRNHLGQVGDGTTIDRNVPTQIGTDTDWLAIDAESYNSMGLKTDGSIWCWGNNLGGQVGNGDFGNGVIASIPTRIGTENDWVKISTGGSRTYAIKSNGTLWGCGYNEYGHLGIGNTNPHYTFVQIGTDTDWMEISAASNQALAIKTNHTLWGWGLNKSGSLAIGIPDTAPVITIPTQTGDNTADWSKVNIGGCCSSKMIKTDGSIWAMGSGFFGNLGIGSLDDINTPTQIGIETNWNNVTTANHSCAVKNNGQLWMWGNNSVGELGNGTYDNSNLPVQVSNNISWKKVIAGYGYTIGVTSDNSLYAWGWNNYGQLGDGTFEDKNIPTLIGNSCTLNTQIFGILNSIKAYPNPTHSATYLSYSLNQNADVKIIITNSLGQIVYQKTKTSTLGENQETIDLSLLSSGVYFISLQTSGQKSTVKVVKN
ncbi:MAG: T9SS type A sorting domain-containing protein [Bacteroidetes bacterium]|nr:T9SS type A sorting domain-containing protein [Bacteroidota bacterium]